MALISIFFAFSTSEVEGEAPVVVSAVAASMKPERLALSADEPIEEGESR